MYGVSKISSEQNIMLTTFPAAQYSAQSLAEHLEVFAKAGIVVDMICQSAPRGGQGKAVAFGPHAAARPFLIRRYDKKRASIPPVKVLPVRS